MQTPEAQKGGSVPLDWLQVKRRYGDGAEIPTVAGGKTVHIVGVDDRQILVRARLWEAGLRREHLEKAVELMEEGLISRDSRFFVDDYKVLVADERATTVAHVFKDLGFLSSG